MINQGVPIDSIVAHDKIGLNGMLHDVPDWHNKNLKINSILLSKENKPNKIKNFLWRDLHIA